MTLFTFMLKRVQAVTFQVHIIQIINSTLLCKHYSILLCRYHIFEVSVCYHN